MAITLSQAIAGFFLDKELLLSPNTIRNYRLNLGRLMDHFSPADPDLSNITAEDLRRFLHQLQTTRLPPSGIAPRPPKPLGAKTIRNIHTCLSSLWTWSVKEHLVDENIVRRVEAPAPPAPDIQPLTQEQITRLLDAINQSAPWRARPETTNTRPELLCHRDRAIILFLLDTGVRASELCGLALADVDLRAGRATVRGKSRLNRGEGTERMVIFGKRTRKALWRYLTAREGTMPDSPLFASRDEEPLDRSHLAKHIKRLGKRAGVDAYPHLFRHTFAINYLRNQGDLLTLKALLGHASMEMVERYARVAKTDVAAAHRIASPVDNWKL